MTNKNKRLAEWENALNLMTDEELQFILEHQEGYYRKFLNMVWEIRREYNTYPVPENKAMMNAIMNILQEMGCRCNVDEDDVIRFWCQGAEFAISIDKKFDYIKIVDNSWKKVKIKDLDTVWKMMRAINKANIWHNVTIAYIIDEEEDVIDFYSSSNIPYFPNYTYLKKFVNNKLVDMLGAHDLVDAFLEEEEKIAIEQSFSQFKPREVN